MSEYPAHFTTIFSFQAMFISLGCTLLGLYLAVEQMSSSICRQSKKTPDNFVQHRLILYFLQLVDCLEYSDEWIKLEMQQTSHQEMWS